MDMFDKQLSHFAFWATPKPEEIVEIKPEPEFLFPESIRFVEPFFAELGKEVRFCGEMAKGTWTRLAVNNGPTERVFAVVLGYCVVGLILAIYLNLLTVGNARTAGRAIRNAIRQQLLVVKVRLLSYLIGCMLTCLRLPASSSLNWRSSLWDVASCWTFALCGYSLKPTLHPGSPSSSRLL